jgi:glycosyltransferase involved in cell wall biosynthesis
MRVLYVHDVFPPDYRGGAEYVLLRETQGLRAIGHDVRVLTIGDPAISAHEGVPTTRLAPGRLGRAGLLLSQAAVDAAAREADVLVGCTYFGLRPAWRAARRHGRPVLFSMLALFGDAWLTMRGPVRGRVHRWLERRWANLPADARLFLSPPSMALAATLGPPQPGDKLLAPGVELQHFAGQAWPAAQREGVAFCGKLDVRKGIETVLAAAAAHPAVPFTIVTWDGDLDALQRRAPPNLRVLPFSGHAALGAVLGRARVFLFPSLAETFGIAVVEAMAAGCAVVSSAPLDFEGARIDAADPAAVLAALAALLADEARCRACGEANARAAQAFGWDRHTQALDRLLHEAVEARARRHAPPPLPEPHRR